MPHGSLHESCVHIHQIWLSRKRDRRAHASDAAAHAVPAALPAFSMAKVATMALLATATHVVLMATSVVADILMVHDDDGASASWVTTELPCGPQ